jgi:hypothetical protein
VLERTGFHLDEYSAPTYVPAVAGLCTYSIKSLLASACTEVGRL